MQGFPKKPYFQPKPFHWSRMTQMEMLDFAMEQGHMVQALLEHFNNMKRQEIRLRFASALLLTTFLATLLWMQFHQQKKEAFSAKMEALTADEESPRRFSAFLKTDPDKNACPQDQSTEQLIPVHWRQMSDGPGYQHFNLTDTSVVHVLTKGLYLINLRISYRTLRNMCQHKDKPMLEVKVTQQHSNYGNERDVITAVESMQCVEFWRQSVTLNKVITLEDDTALRVKIESKTCKYINWHFSSHLEVTYL